VVQSLLHVGHCLFIAVTTALHHHPFLRVLWLGHMFSRSLNRSWLVINDWNRFCEDDAPRLRSSWMRPRVGVLSWHSNSSCSLLEFLSLVPMRFSCFLFDSSRTARHLLVRALLSSSIRIHCIPSVAWDTRVQVEFLVEVKFFCKSSLIKWGMVLVHSSSNHPSSTRSSISSLYFSSFLGRGGGRDVITSYHHCRVEGLLPAILIFLINNFSMEGNSIAAPPSSLRIAWFISLISSRNVSIEVREVRVSPVLEFSLHCSISSCVLLTVLYMVSFTFRSPKCVPCVFQVSSRLSHAFMVSSTLSRKKTTPPSARPRRRLIWFRILFRFMLYLSSANDLSTSGKWLVRLSMFVAVPKFNYPVLFQQLHQLRRVVFSRAVRFDNLGRLAQPQQHIFKHLHYFVFCLL